MKDKKGKECVAGTRRHDLFIRTEALGSEEIQQCARILCVVSALALIYGLPAMNRCRQVSGYANGACSTADGHALW